MSNTQRSQTRLCPYPSVSVRVRPCPSMSVRVRPCLSVSVHVCPCLSVSVRVRPCPSVSVRVRPCPSVSVRVRPCPSMRREPGNQTTLSSRATSTSHELPIMGGPRKCLSLSPNAPHFCAFLRPTSSPSMNCAFFHLCQSVSICGSKKSSKIPRFFPQSVFLPRGNMINSCA